MNHAYHKNKNKSNEKRKHRRHTKVDKIRRESRRIIKEKKKGKGRGRMTISEVSNSSRGSKQGEKRAFCKQGRNPKCKFYAGSVM